jgi:hypothetical protein
MQTRFSSIMVDDQQKALEFYTDALGAPVGAHGLSAGESVLEGPVRCSEPKLMGANKMALFEDTCGNLINLVQTPS